MKIPRPSFLKLVSNYNTTGTHDCSMTFPDTCAIRMSEALVKTDHRFLIEFKVSGKNVCPHYYVRGAQDLAAILKRTWGARDKGWEKLGKTPKFSGSGVICFMNIPTYSGQGHIDLWNNGKPVGQAYWGSSPIWFWRLPQ